MKMYYVLLNQKKWLPLHTLAASGEFYLVDSLLKHNLDINATDVVSLELFEAVAFAAPLVYVSIHVFSRAA